MFVSVHVKIAQQQFVYLARLFDNDVTEECSQHEKVDKLFSFNEEKKLLTAGTSLYHYSQMK